MGAKKVSQIEQEVNSALQAANGLTQTVSLTPIEAITSFQQTDYYGENYEQSETYLVYYYKGTNYGRYRTNACGAKNAEISANIATLNGRIGEIDGAIGKIDGLQGEVKTSKSQLKADKATVNQFKSAMSEIGQAVNSAQSSLQSVSIKAAFDCAPELSLQNTGEDFIALQRSINGANIDGVTRDLDTLITKDEALEEKLKRRKEGLRAAKRACESQKSAQQGMFE